jgi:L-alanine-DL-glutamate epimerase-like enolase superfamily enzyme
MSTGTATGSRSGPAPIERIDVLAVGPDVALMGWAQELPPQHATLTVVRAFDADGHEGVGATPSYSTGRFDLSMLESLRLLAPRVVGRDPELRERIWYDLDDLTLPVLPGARAALDIALWDLVAQRARLPLHRLLGGARDRLVAYASTPMLTDAAAYVEFIAQMRSQGFRAVKIHAWCEPERDLEMLRTVHAAHGDGGIGLMHDAEQRYDRRSAVRVGRELDAMGFEWLEAPLPDVDLDGYRELRRRVHVPILPGGNTIVGLHEVSQALRWEPWDAVRFDVTIAGGFTPAGKLAGLAEAWGLRVELQSWGYTLIQAANLHFGLAHQHTGHFELPVPPGPYEYGVVNPYRVGKDGCVEAPTEPGLGIIVDWERMQQAAVGSFTCMAHDASPDVSGRAHR